MATVPIAPLFLSESKLTIGEDDYSAHISGASFVPSSSTVVWKGMAAGASFTRQTTATWVLNLNYAQDWDSTGSLSQYLHAREGESVIVLLEPVDGGQAFSATVVIAAGTIGGEVDTFGSTSVTLGVLGKPAKVSE